MLHLMTPEKQNRLQIIISNIGLRKDLTNHIVLVKCGNEVMHLFPYCLVLYSHKKVNHSNSSYNH